MRQMTMFKMHSFIKKHFANKPFTGKQICDKLTKTDDFVYQRSACTAMLIKLYNEDILIREGDFGKYRLKEAASPEVAPAPTTLNLSFEETGESIYKYIESLKGYISLLEEENQELLKKAKSSRGQVSIPDIGI